VCQKIKCRTETKVLQSAVYESLKRTKHVSTLLFIKLVGLPLSKFNPDAYVKTWLLSGRRRAEEPACRRKEETEEQNAEHSSVWSVF
jgi:hypothetical protein